MGRRVIVAMSGGVDSSVAALLLQKSGYEVTGVTFRVWNAGDLSCTANTGEEREGEEFSESWMKDVEEIADILRIPLYKLDLRDVFYREVVEYFTHAYIHGYTPNPCVVCNRRIKFRYLTDKARELNAELVSTGHYVRKRYDPYRGRYLLLKGKDAQKDQSYVLSSLSQKQLAKAVFPVGGYKKAEIREMAVEAGLPVAARPESQEICFIPDNDYGNLLRKLRPEVLQPGDIVDTNGKKLGEHNGVAFFTVGQRKGLKIAAPHPLYVVDLRPEKKQVIVGRDKEVFSPEAVVEQINWVSISPPERPFKAEVKIRYTAQPVSALVIPGKKRTVIRFDKPQRAVTPGQVAVFYRGDTVLGGGFITRFDKGYSTD